MVDLAADAFGVAGGVRFQQRDALASASRSLPSARFAAAAQAVVDVKILASRHERQPS
jgi:hypothetical protein